MQWSKLKSNVERFFAPALAGRVELRATRYRDAHDQTCRGYITVDGKEVWNMCSLRFYPEEQDRIEKIPDKTGSPRWKAQIQAHGELHREGILAQWDLYQALEIFCNSPFTQILDSDNALIRALAMLDSRLGKRRLASLDICNLHPTAIYFYTLRCVAEGLPGHPDTSADSPQAASSQT